MGRLADGPGTPCAVVAGADVADGVAGAVLPETGGCVAGVPCARLRFVLLLVQGMLVLSVVMAVPFAVHDGDSPRLRWAPVVRSLVC